MYEKFGLFIDGPGSLIGARERSGMKPSAKAVNTDRGGIADEAALSEVLLFTPIVRCRTRRIRHGATAR